MICGRTLSAVPALETTYSASPFCCLCMTVSSSMPPFVVVNRESVECDFSSPSISPTVSVSINLMASLPVHSYLSEVHEIQFAAYARHRKEKTLSCNVNEKQ
jgi:hypothetical protein